MRLPIKLFFLVSLLVFFLFYSARLYVKSATPDVNYLLPATALEGKMLWQKNNCQACHQFYGLGGYLGPDLTNVYSEKDKGNGYIRAMIKSGSATMPAFTSLSDKEIEQLTEFLRAMDASGKADPRNFTATCSGDIKLKIANE